MPQNVPNNSIENSSRGMEPIVWRRPHLIKVSQVRKEDDYTSRHDVEHSGPLNGPRPNPTAGHSDEAGGNGDDIQSDDSHSQDNHEPDGSEYDDDDDDDGSEEGDGEDEEPALKYERMGGAAQEFFETGKDSASALCVGNDSFVSSTALGTIAASLPMYCTRAILAPLARVSFGRRLLLFQHCNESDLYFREYFRLTI